MKKYIIVLLCVVFSLNTFSQYKIGVYAGTGTFNIKSDQIEFQNSKIGFDLGVGYDYLITDSFEVIIEAGFSMKKPVFTAYDYSMGHLNPKTTEKTLNYLGLDYKILANYNFLDGKLSAQAGLYGDATISHIYDQLENDIVIKFINDEVLPTYGMVFGLSGGVENLKLNVRYSMSLNNPYKESYFIDENDMQIDVIGKHSYLGISLIYYIIK